MIADQVKRFNGQTYNMIHDFVKVALVLIGFAILGVIAGSLVAGSLALIGVIFQVLKVLWLFSSALFCREGIRDDDEDELTAPLQSPRTNASQAPQSMQFKNESAKSDGNVRE